MNPLFVLADLYSQSALQRTLADNRPDAPSRAETVRPHRFARGSAAIRATIHRWTAPRPVRHQHLGNNMLACHGNDGRIGG
jgi:hypothetical protein